MRVSYRFLLVIVSLSISLLIAEVGLRTLDKPKPVPSGWRTSEINPSLSHLEHNQLGFRGRKIEYTDDDFVIILLGDSQVEAVACAYEWMPERRLQFHLNSAGRKVKVFSLGSSGYGQDQELLALRAYYQKFRANLVVLWESPTNDIWNNQFSTTLDGHPKPTFWLEGDQLRGPTEEVGQPARETPGFKLLALWLRIFGRSRDQQWERHLPPAYTAMTTFTGPVKDDWQQIWNSNREARFENVDSERSVLALYLMPRSSRTQYGLDLMRKLIEEIERQASSHGETWRPSQLPPAASQTREPKIHFSKVSMV